MDRHEGAGRIGQKPKESVFEGERERNSGDMGEFMRVPETLIPLSVLGLDCEPSAAGWASDLAELGIRVQLDDIGRACVTRSDARRVMDERRAALDRAAAVRRELEAEREEWHRQHQVVPVGIPVEEIIEGVGPALSMGFHDRPGAGRKSLDAGSLFTQSDEVTYHAFGPEAR
jgi:hypothetical protein